MIKDLPVLIIHRAEGEPQLFCCNDNSMSSLVTPKCLFTREKAWEYVRLHPCDLKKFETYSFKTVGEGLSIFGKTPQEIADEKRKLLKQWCFYNKK